MSFKAHPFQNSPPSLALWAGPMYGAIKKSTAKWNVHNIGLRHIKYSSVRGKGEGQLGRAEFLPFVSFSIVFAGLNRCGNDLINGWSVFYYLPISLQRRGFFGLVLISPHFRLKLLLKITIGFL
jgi:hypothetical protein